MSTFKSFVLANLREAKINHIRTSSSKDISIRCVFKNHIKVTGKKDRSPSLSISVIESKPVFHCWSCGEKGHVNKLFSYLTLPKWKDGEDYKPTEKDRVDESLEKLKLRLDEIGQKYSVPDDTEEWDDDRIWRKLPGGFLKRIGAKRWYDEADEIYRILFLIKNGSAYNSVGHIAGQTDEPVKIKWRNSRGSWIKNYGLFPREFVLRKHLPTVCLVEGPYDALRMNYFDIPTLAFLGTNNWSRVKEATLKANGVHNVVLCLDGDDVGYNTAERIGNLLKKKFNVTIVDLPEGEDPGTLSKHYLKEIADVVKQLNAGKKVDPKINFRMCDDD